MFILFDVPPCGHLFSLTWSGNPDEVYTAEGLGLRPSMESSQHHNGRGKTDNRKSKDSIGRPLAIM